MADDSEGRRMTGGLHLRMRMKFHGARTRNNVKTLLRGTHIKLRLAIKTGFGLLTKAP